MMLIFFLRIRDAIEERVVSPLVERSLRLRGLRFVEETDNPARDLLLTGQMLFAAAQSAEAWLRPEDKHPPACVRTWQRDDGFG